MKQSIHTKNEENTDTINNCSSNTNAHEFATCVHFNIYNKLINTKGSCKWKKSINKPFCMRANIRMKFYFYCSQKKLFGQAVCRWRIFDDNSSFVFVSEYLMPTIVDNFILLNDSRIGTHNNGRREKSSLFPLATWNGQCFHAL